MAPGLDFYLPFTIPVWGVVEVDHMHVDNHLNFIFHADRGRIIGVAAYPGNPFLLYLFFFFGWLPHCAILVFNARLITNVVLSFRVAAIDMVSNDGAVRDNFQYAKPGYVITIHGPVKWFRKGSFSSYSSSSSEGHSHHNHGVIFLVFHPRGLTSSRHLSTWCF